MLTYVPLSFISSKCAQVAKGSFEGLCIPKVTKQSCLQLISKLAFILMIPPFMDVDEDGAEDESGYKAAYDSPDWIGVARAANGLLRTHLGEPIMGCQ